jgi:signal transduction histidine kinase
MTGQLLDNAAKFTQNGKIELTARRLIGETGDQLIVDVIDTGIGIAPDQIKNLFEKFTVADDSSTSKYGGTGLGLALSQKLCKLMGGEVFVESELGKGSRFTIRMPLMAGRRKTDLHGAATLVPDVPGIALQTTAELPHE